MTFRHTLDATDGPARAGMLHTAHGAVPTPVFMPVGTAGTVKAMTADQVRATGAGIVLGNTYHLMLRPGADRVERLGGLTLLHVALPGGASVVVQIEGSDATQAHQPIRLAFDPAACHLFDGDGTGMTRLVRHPLAA